MDKLILSLLRVSVLFVRNVYNCFNSPYVTYRKLSQGKAFSQTVFIILLTLLYFLFVSFIRNGLSNPFFLTVKFNTLFLFSSSAFAAIILILFSLGRMVGGKGEITKVYILWTFSLIPTLLWFFAASVLYLILPPPRTLSIAGKLYSLVFVAFSLAMLIWKSMLYYLTLRFALKLDLWRILVISAVFLPVLVVYTVGMYRLGIFRIPFI